MPVFIKLYAMICNPMHGFVLAILIGAEAILIHNHLIHFNKVSCRVNLSSNFNKIRVDISLFDSRIVTTQH
jgi:hypothetical protein